MASRTYSVRLAVENEAAFKRALEDSGAKGQAALKRIETAAAPASRSLRALDGSARVAGAGMDSLSSRAGATGGILRGFGTGGLFIAAAVGGLALLANAAKNAMASIAAIGDAADRAQIDAGLFESLNAGLLQTGQKTDGLETSLTRFSRSLGEAQIGVGRGVKAFELLGIAVVNVDGTLRTSEDVLRDVADKFAAIESPAERARAATQLFGTAGTALIPLLTKGADGMDALAREAEELGLVFGGDTIRKAQELNAEFDKQWKIVSTQLMSAFVEFAPVVVTLATEFANLIRFVSQTSAELLQLLGILDRPLTIRLATEEASLARLRDELAGAPNAATPSLSELETGVSTRTRVEVEADISSAEASIAALRTQLDALNKPPPSVDLPAVPGTAVTKPGGGKTPASPVDAFAQQAAQMQIRIEALRRVVEGTPGELGQLFLGNDDAAQKGYEAQLKILNEIYEARLKGIELGPEEQADIDKRAKLTGMLVAEDERVLASLQERRAAQKAAIEETKRQAQEFQEFLQGTASSLVGAIAGTESWSDALRKLAVSLGEAALQAALLNSGPLAGLFGGSGGGLLSGLGDLLFNAKGNVFSGGDVVPFARGGVFAGGDVVPFARGGIVSSPTLFPMAGSRTGLMGEAGPEAIMPLARLPGGHLGVRTMGGGGGSVSITYAPTVNAEAGADQAMIEALLARQYQRFRAEVPALVDRRTAENRRSGARL